MKKWRERAKIQKEAQHLFDAASSLNGIVQAAFICPLFTQQQRLQLLSL